MYYDDGGGSAVGGVYFEFGHQLGLLLQLLNKSMNNYNYNL